MRVLRRELLQLVGVIAAACASTETGSAQNYPTRPITMIVPFAAGGTTDVTARIVGEHMSRTLGQQIIVENVVGAGGTVGTARAMRANPDGHTIEMGQMGTHAAAVALYPNLAYKPDLDFEPIGMASGLAALIVARKDFPPKDLQEFITFVKANYNKLNVAHSGVGSIFFTTCLLLNSILDVKPTLVLSHSAEASSVDAACAMSKMIEHGQAEYHEPEQAKRHGGEPQHFTVVHGSSHSFQYRWKHSQSRWAKVGYV